MIPTRKQFQRWSLPTKWAFIGALIGLPATLLSLAIGFIPFVQQQSPTEPDRNQLLYQTTQELRYNREWLADIAVSIEKKHRVLPTGSMKVDTLLRLFEREHRFLAKNAYGEEKYLHQHVLKLKDLATAIGTPKYSYEIEEFNRHSTHTIHDILFANDFLLWYLIPIIEDEFDQSEVYELAPHWLPGSQFQVHGIKRLHIKYFMHKGRPILNFSDYLGLID
jgi:hypothetical protein